jgi:hypothetical protein
LILGLSLAALQTPGADARTNFAAAGWAEVEITPPLGIGLGGRGGPDTHATKVLDPLYAQILILKDAHGTGFVLVSLDVVGIPHTLSEKVRTAIVHELGVDFNLVILNASHTHSGPYMIRELMAGVGPAPQIETDYHAALAEKLISAARLAGKKLRPVTVETFRGTSQVGINRRGTNATGKTAMVPNAKAPINELVWVLKLTPTDGSAPALVFSYSCHAVIAYGYANSAISADFPGVARNALREKLGLAHVQFVQGTAGNVRPRIVADLEHNRFRAPKPEDLQVAGKQLADDVLAALNTKGDRLALNLAGASDRPFFPRGNPPARAIYEAMAKEPGEFRRAAAEYWLKRYDSGEGFAKGDAWPVGLVRLADNQWICCFAGEPCVEWSPKVKQWLGGRNVVVFGYSQEGLTYLPTEALLPQGGYEVDEANYTRGQSPARLAPGIEAAVRNSLKQQLAFIEAGKK